MNMRTIIIIGGAALALFACITYAGIKIIGNKSDEIAELRSTNDELSKKVAFLTSDKYAVELAMRGREVARQEIEAEASNLRSQVAEQITKHSDVADWAKSAMPADLVGLLNKKS